MNVSKYKYLERVRDLEGCGSRSGALRGSPGAGTGWRPAAPCPTPPTSLITLCYGHRRWHKGAFTVA